MATRGQRPSGNATRQRQAPRRVEQGMIPVLAKAVRDVEVAVQRDRVNPAIRVTFQCIALLMREERTRIRTDDMSVAKRGDQLKRLDAIAQVLARTAPRDATLLALLAEDTELLDGTKSQLREMRLAAGLEPPPEEETRAAPSPFSR